MIGNLSGPTLLVILFIVLLLFGAPKLPGLAKSLGQSMRILKKEVRSDSDEPGTAKSEADGPAPQTPPAVPRDDAGGAAPQTPPAVPRDDDGGSAPQTPPAVPRDDAGGSAPQTPPAVPRDDADGNGKPQA